MEPIVDEDLGFIAGKFKPSVKGWLLFYLPTIFEGRSDHTTKDLARQRIEEAQLFIDAEHLCFNRLQGGRVIP